LSGVQVSTNSVATIPEIIRGGLFTVVGSGGATEAAISTGGILAYGLAAGKKAKFKGSIVVSNFGSNNRISLNVFDNVAGRIIPIGSVSSVNDGLNKTVFFEGVLESDDFDFTVDGNNAANDGACAILVEIQESPA